MSIQIKLEITLRCSKCLNYLEAKQNYAGSNTLFMVDPCPICSKELETKKDVEAQEKK